MNADLDIADFFRVYSAGDVDTKTDIFNSIILSIFDFHAPIKTVRITKNKAPWLTSAIKILRAKRDKALFKFKKSKNLADWNFYKTLRNETNYAIKREKKAYLQFKINTGNKNDMWKELKKLNVVLKITWPFLTLRH